MNPAIFHPRFVQARLIETLSDTPVVLIHGPRQCGKTTLACAVGKAAGYDYISFDNDVLRASVKADPTAFVDNLPDKVVLDEVQRVPELFAAIKTSVDRNRQPGRFMLTGSANILLLPNLADSLAGRMEILRLHPLAQSELAGKPSEFMEMLFSANFRMTSYPRLEKNLAERIAAGGYPAALVRESSRRRSTWYRNYIETLVQRDVRDLARISSLDVLPRLLTLAAAQTSHLLNVADLSTPFQLSRPTIRDYVTLLARIFLLEELPPWHKNRLSRLIKTPKLHLGDTGLACALLGVTANELWADRTLLGQLLETFVFQELRRQAEWHDDPVVFHHFRDKDGSEVDIVLESRAQRLVGIEIKSAATITGSDFRGLRKLKECAGKQFVCGVVLYDGEFLTSFGDNLFAIPLRALWEAE
jgi:predicted AAA+ superfamily ATPase